MRNLMIATLATVWVLLVVYLTGRRRHPREVPDHIDRDFRDLVACAHHNATAVPWNGPWQEPCILHNLYKCCPKEPRDEQDCRAWGTPKDAGVGACNCEVITNGQSPH